MTEATKQKQLKKIAKVLAIHGYRNSPIEDLHAGKMLPEKYRKPEWSRITDAEMKEVNKAVCDQIYTLLYMIESREGVPMYFASGGSDWDEPKLIKEWMRKREKEIKSIIK